MTTPCLLPVPIDAVLEDPDTIRSRVEANGPYAPVQRYFTDDAAYRATAGSKSRDQPVFIAPVFRGDWVYEKPLIQDVDDLLHHSKFTQAASRIFGTQCIRPFSVYCNLTWQLPFPQGSGHIDVPEFRGVNRSDHPIWLLTSMNHSRLFEAERVQIATAVAWFYQGRDGGFDYWPDGPDAPMQTHEGAIFNTAVVGDNDRMFHRVRPTGNAEKGMLTGLTPDARLVYQQADAWTIEDRGETRAELSYTQLRISISWKARVFEDSGDETRFLQHTEDMSIDGVWERFRRDLDRRGVEYQYPENPERDPVWIELLSKTYVEEPRAAATAA